MAKQTAHIDQSAKRQRRAAGADGSGRIGRGNARVQNYINWIKAVELADHNGDSSSLKQLLRSKVPITGEIRELLAELFERRKLRPVSRPSEEEYKLLAAADDYYELRGKGMIGEELLKLRDELLSEEVSKSRRAGRRVTLQEMRRRPLSPNQAVDLAARYHHVDEDELRQLVIEMHGGTYKRLQLYLRRLRAADSTDDQEPA